MQMLAFNFASRKFAHRRHAQGLSRSVSALQVSLMSTWIQLSKLTNVLSTWVTLERQPIMVRNQTGTFGHFSSAFTKQG